MTPSALGTRQSEVLTLQHAELREFTGRARRSDQEAWLRERGIPYRWDGERLLVSRTMADRWLAGGEMVQSREPNLQGVR